MFLAIAEVTKKVDRKFGPNVHSSDDQMNVFTTLTIPISYYPYKHESRLKLVHIDKWGSRSEAAPGGIVTF